MLYDPYSSSEDGVIVLFAEAEESDDDVFVKSWESTGGITLQQEDDMICLTAEQVEVLYQVIKHNR